MSNPQPIASCLNCNRTEMQTPLVNLRYQANPAYICTQCLPMLIHHPQELAGKLAGAETLEPAAHHDH